MRTGLLRLSMMLVLVGTAWAANPVHQVQVHKQAPTIQTDPHRFAGTIQEIDKQKSTITVVGQEVSASSSVKKTTVKNGKPETFKYTI
ncbi:MAG: hypothetical protein NTY53_13395, partial [Kiritimatiellaeota bacterium]|nr:hypothetical protein [Kiritimatiellota bacterium]